MKRSEMIKIMHKKVSSILHTLEEFNLRDCEELLTIMEEAGMLPPQYNFMMGGMKASDNAWESENG